MRPGDSSASRGLSVLFCQHEPLSFDFLVAIFNLFLNSSTAMITTTSTTSTTTSTTTRPALLVYCSLPGLCLLISSLPQFSPVRRSLKKVRAWERVTVDCDLLHGISRRRPLPLHHHIPSRSHNLPFPRPNTHNIRAHRCPRRPRLQLNKTNNILNPSISSFPVLFHQSARFTRRLRSTTTIQQLSPLSSNFLCIHISTYKSRHLSLPLVAIILLNPSNNKFIRSSKIFLFTQHLINFCPS